VLSFSHARAPMKSLPNALVGSLLALIMVGCGGGNHPSAPAPLASPSIASQPASQTIYSGGTASFSIAVNGNPAPSVVWQRSDDKGATWTAIAGATAATYNFTVQPADTGAQFRALATNSKGNVLSTAATLREVPAVYAGGRIDVTNPESGYWINGTWVPLPSPTGTTAQVNALSVSGNKVFAAGSWLGASAGVSIPTGYWLDGNWIDLALPSGSTWGIVYSLVVSANDLYLAGELAPGSPGYWLNGTWNGLPVPPGSDAAWLISLAVSGSDVYAAGWKVSNGMALPGYWFDGTWVDLPPPSGSVGGIVESIVVSGSGVFAAGYADPTGTSYYAGNPGYWLNGSWVGLALPTGQTAGAVTSLVVSGTDVYAAGFCENASDIIPGYWLNGAWVGLTVPPGKEGGVVTSLVLSGGKVYAAGYSGSIDGPVLNLASFSSTAPGYWVNDVWVGLPIPSPGTGFSSVSSLAVIP
jgi:Immunoglobulin I-set domain